MSTRSELWAAVYKANVTFMPEGAADAALRSFDERFPASPLTPFGEDEEAFHGWMSPRNSPAYKEVWYAALAYARRAK